ncbi:type II secretion system protein GspC [Trichloromonas sp.]|uniref:type II secretion system protein GspC n=1 Tax=Trichloromonas sp. TaxID=3069249 RepID=UPI003D814F00
MLFFLQRYVQATWLLLITFTGVALGCLTATILGLGLGDALPKTRSTGELVAPVGKKSLADYAIISQRNIFDSTAPGLPVGHAAENTRETRTVAPRRADLKLVGTVTGGEDDSLALIEADKTLKAYRLDDAIPGGGRLIEVSRNVVSIEYDDGSIAILPLYPNDSPRQKPASPVNASGDGIRPLERNRWLIDTRVVDEARANLGEVLKSARMEPRLVNGATDGFAIVMVRPGSLLARMGLQKGDVVLQVNGMPLNSPEKALQVFQQLREARSLSISLERQGQPTLFEYEVN